MALNTTLWQHPYVNVFKLCNLPHWTDAVKSGDVQVVLDKEIGKNVYRIWGKIPATNHIRLPGQPSHALGLTGQFLYSMIRPSSDKVFVIHADVVSVDGTPLRISISNLFKKQEVSSSCIRLPFRDVTDSWTILGLDIPNSVVIVPRFQYAYVKALQLGGCIKARNMYTSDFAYSSKTLPRDMRLSLVKTAEDSIRWKWIPATPPEDPVLSREPSLSALTARLSWKGRGHDAVRARRKPLSNKEQQSEKGQTDAGTMSDTGANAKEDHLKSHVTREDKQSRENNQAVSPAKSAMEAERMMVLERAVGFSGAYAGTVTYSPDGSVVVFPSGSLVVIVDPDTGKQSFLHGHTEAICAIAFSSDGRLLVTAQRGRLALIRIWDFNTGQCLAILTGHATEVFALDVSADRRALVAAGLDAHAKQLIVVWDISDIVSGGLATLVLKQTTDYDIRRIRFSPLEEDHLVTCGKDSIRMYRLRHGQLRGCSIQLGAYRHVHSDTLTAAGGAGGGRAPHIFTDFFFEIADGYGSLEEKRMFVASDAGAVFQVNYGKMVTELVFQLHHGPINCIAGSDGYCVTGSDDGYVRVWPLDFSDFYLEAKHDGPITSVSASEDGLKVAVGTKTCSVGSLDLTTQAYQTLIRAHQGQILALAFDPVREQFATAASDCTVRVWDVRSGEQLYEFDALGECPSSLQYHPSHHVLACGFSSGMMRIFQVPTTTLVQEHRQHRGTVTQLAYVGSGVMLISAGAEGNLCVYDVAQNYFPVKLLSATLPGKVVTMSVSRDGNLLAALGSDEQQINVYSIHDFTKLATVVSPSAGVLKISFSPDGQRMYALATDQRVECWDLVNGQLLGYLGPTHRHACTSFDFTGDGRFMISGGHDRLVKVWDLTFPSSSARQPFQSFIGHYTQVGCIAISPNGTQVLTASTDGAVLTWRLHGQTPVQRTGPTPPDASSEPPRPGSPHCASCATEGGGGEEEATPPSRASESPQGARQEEEISGSSRLSGATSGEETEARELGTVSDTERKRKALESAAEGSVAAVQRDDGGGTSVEGEATEKEGVGAGLEGAGQAQDGERSSATDANPLGPRRHWKEENVSRAHAPQQVMQPPQKGRRLELCLATGLSHRAHDALVWQSGTGLLAFPCGSILVIEDLQTRKQRQLMGHTQEISAVTASLSGSMLASGSGLADDSGSAPILLWDAFKGDRRHTLSLHRHGVQALAFSPSGARLASVDCHSTPTVGVWDAQNGLFLVSDKLDTPVHCMCWLPSSSSLASLWDFATGSAESVDLWKVEAHGDHLARHRIQLPWRRKMGAAGAVTGAAVTCIVFEGGLPGREGMLVGTADGSVWRVLLEVRGGLLTPSSTSRLLVSNGGLEIRCLRLHTKGRMLLVGTDAHRLDAWELTADSLGADDGRANGIGEPKPAEGLSSGEAALPAITPLRARKRRSGVALDGAVIGIAFDEAGSEGVVATDASSVWYVHLGEKTAIPLLRGHTSAICAMAERELPVPPEPRDDAPRLLLASAASDGSLRVWAQAGAGATAAMEDRSRDMPLSCILTAAPAATPLAGQTAPASSSSTTTPRDPACTPPPPVAATACTAAAVSPTGAGVSAGYADGRLCTFTMQEGAITASSRPHSHPVVGCHYSADSTRLLAAFTDGVLCVVDVRAHAPLALSRDFTGHKSRLTGLALSPLHPDIGACAWRDSLEVFKIPWTSRTVEKLAHLKPLPGGSAPEALPGLVAFSPSDPSLVIFSCPATGPAILLYDFRNKMVVRQLHVGRNLCSMAVSRGGRELAIGTPDGLLRILSCENGTWQDYLAHSGSVSAVSFSHSNQMLYSAAGEVMLSWVLSHS